MPISKLPNETKDEFISRCVVKEMNSGKTQEQSLAICISYSEEHFSATASINEPPVSIELAKISIDYDNTFSTSKGMELAKRLISEGNDVYIISARSTKEAMLSRAAEAGIPASRVYATGSNRAKVEKIKELGIKRHYDDNSSVISDLPSIGHKFKSQRSVIFNEDFNEEVVRDYKARGFKVHIRSSRKIKKKDNKVWNKLRSVGLSEDHLVFGEIKELNRRYQYDEFCTGNDPILEFLKAQTPVKFKNEKVIKTIPINSIEDINLAIEESKKVDIKFASVKVLFVYSKRDDVDGVELLPTSREFCKDVMFAQGAMQGYTAEQIGNLPTEHLIKMGLPPDPFTYRGGFYTKKGGQRGPDTTPFCRHQWKAKVVLA